jgi:hypothetical protein
MKEMYWLSQGKVENRGGPRHTCFEYLGPEHDQLSPTPREQKSSASSFDPH